MVTRSRRNLVAAERLRGRSLSRKRVSLPVMPPDVDGDALPRPALYEECRGGHRPCPIVSCPNNNYLTVMDYGRLKLNHPGVEPWEIPPDQSCAGDMTHGERSNQVRPTMSHMSLVSVLDGRTAPRGGESTLEEIGESQGVSRERIRQIERDALRKMMARLADRGWSREDVLEYLASIKGEGEGNMP